jgi:hypothetical protein
MLLAYLISYRDPLAENEETIQALAGDHPALSFLEGVGFRWPSTLVPSRGSGLFDADLLRVGYLKYKGYAVGKTGLTASARRRTLRSVYFDAIPAVFPPHYVDAWGRPASSKRLQKIAESIAAFCRNSKRKFRPPMHAIEDWEEDLAWLKQEFYDGHYRFRWPDTEIW